MNNLSQQLFPTAARDWQPDRAAWRRDYEETGYLVVEDAVDRETLDALRAQVDRIEAEVAADSLPDNLKRFLSFDRDRARSFASVAQGEGQHARDAISNIMELPLFAPIFRDLILYPRVLDALETLFASSEFSFYNTKCICKMAGNGTAFQWHRDLPYLQHTSPNLITCMICLDAMTPENGATVVCPGTHRIAHADVLPGDTDIAESEVPNPRVTVECPAGAAVLFHTNIVHGGGPNRSDGPRRNVISIWRGPDTYSTRLHRMAGEGLMPRSHDAARQRQIAMTWNPEAV